jgi:hypothetical protein
MTKRAADGELPRDLKAIKLDLDAAEASYKALKAEHDAHPLSKTHTTHFEWRIYTAGGHEGNKHEEDIPDMAIEFLELVDPDISITASKHDYWETSWGDFHTKAYAGVDETQAEEEIAPVDWREEGQGVWHDAVEEEGWEAYEFFVANHDTLDEATLHKQTLTLWNHDDEKRAYAERCATRRALVDKRVANTVLTAASKNKDGKVDLAQFKRAFPGCPFQSADDWAVGTRLAEYYGLTPMNRLTSGAWSKPATHKFMCYAQHFNGTEDYSDYDLYYLDPARPGKEER